MTRPTNLIVENDTAAVVRADLNDILIGLASQHNIDASNVAYASGPDTIYPNMLWYDLANETLKMRNNANTAWVDVAFLDQSENKFIIKSTTEVFTALNGTRVGYLGAAASTVWNAGTSSDNFLISPALLSGAITALVTSSAIQTATAAVLYGSVGSYVIAGKFSVGTITAGSSHAGSTLKAAGFQSAGVYSDNTSATITGPILSGTWRAMGQAANTGARFSTTLFLRVV